MSLVPILRLERGLLLLAALCALGGASARACGPVFPNRYLDVAASDLLAAPEAIFAVELGRLLPAGTSRATEPRPDYDADRPSAAERTASADLDELAAALRLAGSSAADVARVTDAYRAARRDGGEAPTGLPREFALYWDGARAWKRDDLATARAAWAELLTLPEAERRHRSVWAAYMLGRSFLNLPAEQGDGYAGVSGHEADDGRRDDAEAERWFAAARALAGQGFADSLGLAGQAKGWQARLHGEARDYLRAIHLYLERLEEGDDTAYDSLRRMARRVVRETYGDERERCVRDDRVRGVVVAWLLARGATIFDWSETEEWPTEARRWAMEIHRAGGRELPGADRLAWLAYEGGLFGLAAEWLELASAASSEAGWLTAKLALRDGRLEDAARHFRRALDAGDLPLAHQNLLHAELGRVWLALDRPADALAAWMAGGHWEDAAFVAERVLTTEELAAWVDAAPPSARAPTEERPDRRLRDLLARRLAREGDDERALAYFSEAERTAYATYRADVRTGFDDRRPAAERAPALWRAASLLRERGMELIGTELEPDWAIWGGAFDLGSDAEARLGVPAMEGGVFAPTADERARLGRHLAPGRRFHYRYVAAELAWWAASLSPDDSEATARMLREAGGWLKARDPKAAEPFYQALVLRCGRTASGREATRLRWFPPDPVSEDGSANASP